MDDNNKEEPKEISRIYIEFEGTGSAHFQLKVENISPMQLLTLAGYFEFEAKFALSQQKNAQLQMMEQNRLLVPQKGLTIGKTKLQ